MEANSRKKKLMYNTVSSVVFQIAGIICGFVLPRLILRQYGSEVNGLVDSITHFLQIIAFLELGVGAVVQSSLYKPLAANENRKINEIVTSGNRFFKRIGQILLGYICLLIFIYPVITKSVFDVKYTGVLIISIGLSSFAQYYFGIVDRLLLTADQKGYIQYTVQTITLILNTIVCAVFISLGYSIQIVKLTTSLIYLFRPIVLRIYINRHYSIDRNVGYSVEPIKQKWNGIAQHVAAVILEQADTVILTVWASLTAVSIYSVYHLVLSGVKKMFLSMTNGIQSLLGELWAKQEIDELTKFFGWVEWTIHVGTVLIFGCVGVLIVPFVEVYTFGVSDVNYIQPIFAVLITTAHAFHCLRLPYNLMILAGGHYKQTQSNYFVAATLNIVISVMTVRLWGIIGVAIGTLVAMTYQTIWMALYDSKNFICWPFKQFVKRVIVDILTVIVAVVVTSKISLVDVTYTAWIVLAIKVFVIWLVISIIINCAFYFDRMRQLGKKIRNKLFYKVK